MSKAIRIHAHGGPEVLKWEQLPTPRPNATEALIRHEAIGVNYIDIYFRTGLYKTALPATLGIEGAGEVIAVGEKVTNVAPGDRVAYAGGSLGGYATERVINADRLVKLPEAIDSKTAAGMMLRGLTAYFLLHRTFKVQKGQKILVHAAAGGVGLILCQWAKHLGVEVIGVVSSEAKAELIKANGAAHAIIGHANLVAEVKQITGGAMLPVVYDSVGKDTFNASLDCLAPLGLMVCYGSASGPVPPFDISTLVTKGCLFLTRPSFATYMAAPQDIATGSAALFEAVLSGAVTINVNQSFPL
ncbi:MAG: quinone oxidoreductase, partial [Rhodospirillales bacterium]|nr:quinone oxidoreductase [Rhodospirillales bacterium]